MSEHIDVDTLIVGSGISGLYLSLLLKQQGGRVLLVTKDRVSNTGTIHAQGGVASVISDFDSVESHMEDTMTAGAGLNDPEAVRVLVSEGPAHIKRLLDMGAAFERDDEGNLLLTREGGHTANRILYAGDHTGKEILDALERKAKEDGVEILEFNSVIELITRYHLIEGDPRSGSPRCYGAYVYDRKTGEIRIVRAKATVLATGGAGQVYLHNTNPEVSTGDGVALAYRAGAIIANMEFYQFHPTALYTPDMQDTFLISEAVRGHGAVLRDINGRSFMKEYDFRGDLAPRDIVTRAIDTEMKKSGSPHVWLDTTHMNRVELMGRFPTIFNRCEQAGIDISRDWIPVVPAAHYMCGGVHTDLNGQTCVVGLFAAGETAHTGVHGGNRLASNSLLEGLVFSGRIAEYLKSHSHNGFEFPRVREWDKEGLENIEEWILVQHNIDALKRIMHNYVGIVRSNLRLNRALRRINLLYDEIEDFYRRTFIQNKILELRNMTTVARMIVLSALARKESRGLHYNQDYPEDRTPSTNYTLLQRGQSESGAEYPRLLSRRDLCDSE